MKMKKLFVVFLVVSLVVVSLAGCSQEAAEPNNGEEVASEESITIGVSIANYDDLWLNYLMQGMKDYVTELDDPSINVIYVDAKNDPATQLGQVENFISQEVDAMVINPVNSEAAQSFVEKTEAADIPLIAVNRPIEGATANVASDSIKAGRMQMEYLAEQLGGEGNVAIMQGELGHESTEMRTKGVEEIAAEYPDIEIVAVQTANYQRAEGMSLMENWLQTDLEIDAIASNNDEMAIGAINAIEAEGRLDEFIIGGVDATPDALSYMKDGKLDVTIFQSADGQGSTSIETAIKAAKGEEVDEYVWVPYELVTPEDVDEYIAKWE